MGLRARDVRVHTKSFARPPPPPPPPPNENLGYAPGEPFEIQGLHFVVLLYSASIPILIHSSQVR